MKKEIIRYNGSSSMACAIQSCVEGGGKPNEYGIHTCDIRNAYICYKDQVAEVKPNQKVCKVSETLLGATYFIFDYQE